ncbi:methylated-DNA--[protein]-cysteine S-methyltransferase [Clostridium isatidis]|uniref:Methylated-DNA--protein-cysteine methyltransferase n=1 Tax=Clostridium isatidis TaxID=182773 RepID=A0A343JF31_9CLOT|nr:methylated-DNA--[protein]-cysteine S-methyltransferase [Clostridium isatidis]ASW44139.1 cysteine methyltransferase [Clostridium isatidis]NLZ33386.1 methylated-DNA--[protein]-cysteine S-methyltransferase [Clostridiales bacterium]
MISGFCYETVIGEITIIDNGEAIIELDFGNNLNKDIEIKETELIKKAKKQLDEYFNGERKEFNLPLELKGTEFQRKVWKALINIPYGRTKTYKEIAIEVGNEKACRAVGMANNKNPIAIIIPCHRVIGSNNKLVGYAGGLELKEKLLSLEKTTVKTL